jgi:hypothetical protein
VAVNPDVVAVALGRTAPESPEFEQWDMWISDALMLIGARLVGEGDGQVASLDDLDQTQLDYVVREAVVAQVRRPDDATEIDVRVDDGGVSRKYRSGAGRVTIRDEWWDLLSPTDSTSGAFSISIGYGCAAHLAWCSLMMGATYCSCGVDIAGFPLFETAEE